MVLMMVHMTGWFMPLANARAVVIPNLDIILSCPVDGLVMTALRNVQGVTGDNTDDDLRLGGHIHVKSDSVVGCINGHQWKVQEFILERVG